MKKLLRRTGAWLIAPALLTVASAFAADTATAGTSEEPSSVYKAIGLGAAAAFAIGISVLGAGYAVGRIGSAAMGAAAEKPELLTRSLLFVALAEGLAVLGFAIAMMIVQKI
jgi:V/A-type H+-transporting ATPase subunit K